ncbi:hypothetical protein FRX31_004790 [Thalictrum thalictroides]|uniref:Uncharacterized protein n=1 Tax=Thalictrum thalictroides TaxID=46969 RepID=A0A7J6X7E5_THATH|nr:hypothetical protein FRX31_004790 [Thalictrum thalictroides]
MRNNNIVKNESKFIRFIKAPLRILGRARDLYVQSLSNCSGTMSYGSFGFPSGPIMPRSFSVNSLRSNEDGELKELMRAASQRSQREKLEIQQQSLTKLPRSYTVGIGRIDEDEACEFEEDLKVKPEFLYPRSKSHAVTKRTSYIY